MKVILMLVYIQGGLPYAEPVGTYASPIDCLADAENYADGDRHAVCVGTDADSHYDMLIADAREFELVLSHDR